MSLNTLRTEVATCVVTEVKEVFSPNLNESTAILGTVTRVDSMHYGWFVVAIRD